MTNISWRLNVCCPLPKIQIQTVCALLDINILLSQVRRKDSLRFRYIFSSRDSRFIYHERKTLHSDARRGTEGLAARQWLTWGAVLLLSIRSL